MRDVHREYADSDANPELASRGELAIGDRPDFPGLVMVEIDVGAQQLELVVLDRVSGKLAGGGAGLTGEPNVVAMPQRVVGVMAARSAWHDGLSAARGG